MNSMQDMEQVLRDSLPIELHDRVPELVSLLRETLEKARSASSPQDKVISPELGVLLELLAGKELRTEQAVLSFGAGNQIGDITIRDIAGRDINKNTINLQVDNYTINHKTYHTKTTTSRGNDSYPRRRELIISREGTISTRKPKSPTKTSRPTSSSSRSGSSKSPSTIAKDFYVGVKVVLFAVIGFLFGWYATIFITNTQYLYATGNEFSTERFMGALIAGVLGAVIGMSFTSRRRRASGIAWWGHILGVGITGTISYSLFRDITVGVFWIGGVVFWFFFWLAALGGYKEFR